MGPVVQEPSSLSLTDSGSAPHRAERGKKNGGSKKRACRWGERGGGDGCQKRLKSEIL